MSTDAQDKIEHACAVWSQDYEKHRPRLQAYAWRLTGNAAAAEDVVQNVILKILRLSPDPESVASRLGYLLRSVHHASMDWLKKQMQISTVSIDTGDRRELEQMAEPEREADDDSEAERRLVMASELKRLNKRERKVLTLYLEGNKCPEIALMLNEDQRVISYELNAVRVKVRYRLQRRFREHKRLAAPRK